MTDVSFLVHSVVVSLNIPQLLNCDHLLLIENEACVSLQGAAFSGEAHCNWPKRGYQRSTVMCRTSSNYHQRCHTVTMSSISSEVTQRKVRGLDLRRKIVSHFWWVELVTTEMSYLRELFILTTLMQSRAPTNLTSVQLLNPS